MRNLLFIPTVHDFDETAGRNLPQDLLGTEEKGSIRFRELADQLNRNVEQRDTHYASVVNTNLQEGEQGILIVGAQHGVLSELDEDIKVGFISDEAEELWNLRFEGTNVFSEEVVATLSHTLSENLQRYLQVTGMLEKFVGGRSNRERL